MNMDGRPVKMSLEHPNREARFGRLLEEPSEMLRQLHRANAEDPAAGPAALTWRWSRFLLGSDPPNG